MSPRIFLGLAAALLSLAAPAPASAEPRLAGSGHTADSCATYPRRHAIAAFGHRHSGAHALRRHPGHARALRPSLHRPGVFRRGADRAFDRGHRARPRARSFSARPAYRVTHAPIYRVYAEPIYGSTVAASSPSLPLYNRPN